MKPLEEWVGSDELGFVLSVVGNWEVGCSNHQQAADAVAYAEDRGYISRRFHSDAARPSGVQAFELTNAGLDELRRLRGDAYAEKALAMREWYRTHAGRPLGMPSGRP
jgi:hypothetical protein